MTDTSTPAPSAKDTERFGRADEIEISTYRPDRTLRRFVPIWIVTVDGRLYVRSYRGADGAWYRHATAPDRDGGTESAPATGAVRAGVQQLEVSFAPVDDDENTRPINRDAHRHTERNPLMSEQNNTEHGGWTGGQKAFGDFAPAMVHYTDKVLFDEVWEREGLSKRDRSLITVAALTAMGKTDQLQFHIGYAHTNGVTDTELKEAITHLAFYTGWPNGMSAMTVAKKVRDTDN